MTANAIEKMRKFLISRQFMIGTAAFAAISVSLGAEIPGMILMALLIAFILVVCDDIMATTLPFLLICMSMLQCYDFVNNYIKGNELFYVCLGVPVVLLIAFSFFFHFIKYKRPIKIGKSFWGILAVAVAVTLGGIGSISVKEYFGGSSLYYIAGLGVGMAICYLLIKSQMDIKRDYDLREKFVDIMYIAGIYACFFMAEIYIENYILVKLSVNDLSFIDFCKDPGYYLSWTAANDHMLQPGNNISTFIMLFMPFPFYRAAKSNKKIYHLISAFLMLFMLFASRSRGGLYLGTVEFVICLVAYAIMAKDKLSKVFGLGLVMVGIAVGVFAVIKFDIIGRLSGLLNSIVSKLEDPEAETEARVGLLVGAYENFKESPIFGKGLGYFDEDLARYYSGKTGTMQWYHMMIPQVIASMGILGIFAYGYQIIGRVWAVIKKFSPYVLTLGLSYFGMLLMSQVNPGEFCPLPYALMVVMLFIMIEQEPNREKKIKTKK